MKFYPTICAVLLSLCGFLCITCIRLNTQIITLRNDNEMLNELITTAIADNADLETSNARLVASVKKATILLKRDARVLNMCAKALDDSNSPLLRQPSLATTTKP